MSHNLLYHWMQTIARHLRALSLPKQRNLAAFSIGLVRAQNCRLSAIAENLPELGTPDTVLRRLQRFLSQGPLPDARVQQQLAQWVLNALPADQRLVLRVDETALHDRLRVMAVCVAYHGRALPIAWECYPPDAYPEGGQVVLAMRLLDRIASVVPPGREVLVEADRGIGCSPALLRAIARRGWYYLMRVQRTVRLILEDGREVEFGTQVCPGELFESVGWAFKKGGWLRCRALGWWREGCEEAWLLVTNHLSVEVSAYRVRMWEELAFRDFKSGGWDWQRSRVWSASHAMRLWLVMALAYLWMISVGSWAVAEGVVSVLVDIFGLVGFLLEGNVVWEVRAPGVLGWGETVVMGFVWLWSRGRRCFFV